MKELEQIQRQIIQQNFVLNVVLQKPLNTVEVSEVSRMARSLTGNRCRLNVVLLSRPGDNIEPVCHQSPAHTDQNTTILYWKAAKILYSCFFCCLFLLKMSLFIYPNFHYFGLSLFFLILSAICAQTYFERDKQEAKRRYFYYFFSPQS